MKVTIPKPIPGEEHKKIHIDDWDMWNVDYTLACVIHPVLEKYREKMSGYPELWEDGMITSHNYDRQLHFDIFDEEVEREYLLKKWKGIVDKMCRAFGMIVHKEDWEDTWLDLGWSEARAKEQEYYKAIDEGLALFAKHYHSLWD